MASDDRPGAKILTLEELLLRRARARSEGRTVVQCHGCFDIVHPGHIRHLQHAAKQGDLLLVSITADAGVNKGEGRPLFAQDLRSENLAALNCVDWVYVNPESTAAGLLEAVRPDVYIKGREYESNDDPRFAAERSAVDRHGGRVVFSSGDVVFSSTALVRAIDRGEGGEQHTEDPIRARLRQLRRTCDLTLERISALVAGFSSRRMVVVGETILDTYVHCDRPEVASESPVLALRPMEEQCFDGGAAVIARQAASLGARATLVTLLPRSPQAEAFRDRMRSAGVDVRSVDVEGRIAEKQRFLVGTQKVMKLDRVESVELDSQSRGRLVEMAQEASDGAGIGVIADYGLGTLTAKLVGELCRSLRGRVELLAGTVSGRRASLPAMQGADWLSPSEYELRETLHDYTSSLPALVWKLMRQTSARAVVTMLGHEGVIAFDRRPGAEHQAEWTNRLRSEHVPALNPSPIDPLGCSEAFLAAGVLARSVGADLASSAYLGSIAASEEASMLGNHSISASRLIGGARAHDEARIVVKRGALARVRLVS